MLSYIECGKPAHYLAELIRNMAKAEGQVMQPDSRIDHVVFCYENRNMEMHALLLQEWWNEKKLTQNKQ